MAEKITPRAQDFSQWYQDIVLQAKLADYSPVKGCMVIRPNGYAIWEQLQRNLDARFKKVGVKNAYFPLLIPESFMKKEAEHVEGFAPELAVVTHAGGKKLEENLVIRPTSETIINSMFAKWIQSYRDLPMVLNQWCNVVRWEMRTRLFLRTTEFLWQEGHTCHATAEGAEDDTRRMLRVYADFAEEVLAIPVIPGLKSDAERFAGALRTYCIEAMMQDKKALQAGTSHNLSTNFAVAFDTKFLDKDSTQKHVHQTSWGVSTRLIGAVIMTHSDDKGLVLPPRLATTHVAIVPIIKTGAATNAAILETADKLAADIAQAGASAALPYDVGVHVDKDETKQPGWKFFEYELLGIPVRIELGPRDLEKGHVVVTRRDEGKKEFIPLAEAPARVATILAAMQKDLLERARAFRESNTTRVATYDEFKKLLDDKGGFFIASWCESKACEAKVKEETKATIRCLPLDDQYKMIAESGACMSCGGQSANGRNVRAIFARAY